jgi:hypothetical protein
MSIKSKAFAVAATMTMVGGASTVGLMSAQAETPSCGGACTTVSTQLYPTGFVLDVWRQGEKVGTPVILYRTSTSDPAEDFTVTDQGLVSTFPTDILSTHLALQYGNYEAFELEYSPYGVDSGLCVGTGSTAADGTPVALENCGQTGRTVWVNDTAGADDSAGYHPLINGSDTNFSHPYVLNYPGSSYPTDEPRPQLTTWTMSKYQNSIVYNNQEWLGAPAFPTGT